MADTISNYLNGENEMLGNYTEETLNKLHGIILDALKDFDRVCRKYNITYFVGFGTAIGAVRHHGFIPWDDDIDICMLREEYEKLHKVSQAEWGEASKFFLADPRDGVKIHRTLFPCLYLKGTVFESEGHVKYLKQDNGENYPVHIDIFLFDYFNPAKLHSMIKVTDNFKRLILYSTCKYRVIASDPINKRISCRIKRTMGQLLKLTGCDSRKIYDRYLKYLKKNSGNKITGFELVETYEKYAFVSTYDEMFPVVYIDFEDMKIPLNRNYHDIMTKLYGDYMAIPPVEKRWNGAPAVLDLGDGRGNMMST